MHLKFPAPILLDFLTKSNKYSARRNICNLFLFTSNNLSCTTYNTSHAFPITTSSPRNAHATNVSEKKYHAEMKYLKKAHYTHKKGHKHTLKYCGMQKTATGTITMALFH